jgi:hypothetical protein
VIAAVAPQFRAINHFTGERAETSSADAADECQGGESHPEAPALASP